MGEEVAMTKVLIALDHTEASTHAARTAVALFPDATLLVVNVAQMPVPWVVEGYGAVYSLPPNWPPPIEELRAALAADCATAGVTDAELIAESGDPAHRICQAADEHDVDLIVVGAHHKGVLRRLVDPSVSLEVVHEAHRPVLVVPALED
jgi:nucleotide-binding universal stress UspA family protein